MELLEHQMGALETPVFYATSRWSLWSSSKQTLI